MTNTTYIAALALGLAFAGICPAQTVPYSRNTLTNRDVVVLAKAGFNEDFIIETILSSRTRFDTTVDGLAELAKQGMTERLIRVMMSCDEAKAAAAAAPGTVTVTAVEPPDETQWKARSVKVSPVSMALSGQTPYYEWTSFFWGLRKKKVGVGAVVQQNPMATHLGIMYQDVRTPRQSHAPQYQALPANPAPTFIQP